MAYSAFDDRSLEPRDSDLAEVLGDSQDLWTDLISRAEEQFQPPGRTWQSQRESPRSRWITEESGRGDE